MVYICKYYFKTTKVSIPIFDWVYCRIYIFPVIYISHALLELHTYYSFYNFEFVYKCIIQSYNQNFNHNYHFPFSHLYFNTFSAQLILLYYLNQSMLLPNRSNYKSFMLYMQRYTLIGKMLNFLFKLPFNKVLITWFKGKKL